jgi:sulfite oxidase
VTPAFGKDPGMSVWQEAPFNAEPPPAALLEPVTPNDRFYVRGHGEVPELDPGGHSLSVDGFVERELSLDVDALLRTFPTRTLTATLQCAGNRRGEMMEVRDIEGEIPWGPCVVGTAEWTGVALADVLGHAGVSGRATHVELAGAEPVDHGEGWFGASIPLHKALGPEVLLVWEMNGEPLPPVHGGPLRAVVPGYIGARSVKWLRRVRLLDGPSANHFQAVGYRLHPPGANRETAHPADGIPLGELGVNCAILTPAPGAELEAGPAEIRGYAITGGDSRVARVDVSVDGGERWQTAELGADQGRWAWRLWRAEVDLMPGRHELVARAVDSAANTQPERVGPLWNFQGYANNAWSRAGVTVRSQAGRSVARH